MKSLGIFFCGVLLTNLAFAGSAVPTPRTLTPHQKEGISRINGILGRLNSNDFSSDHVIKLHALPACLQNYDYQTLAYEFLASKLSRSERDLPKVRSHIYNQKRYPQVLYAIANPDSNSLTGYLFQIALATSPLHVLDVSKNYRLLVYFSESGELLGGLVQPLHMHFDTSGEMGG